MRPGAHRFAFIPRPSTPPDFRPPLALAAVVARCVLAPAGASDPITRVKGAPGRLLSAAASGAVASANPPLVGAPVRHTLVRPGLAAGGLVVGIDRETGML